MTATLDPATTATARAGEQVVLLARLGAHRVTLTAGQVVDIVAAQLAAGRTMPTPTPGPRDDLYAGFHVLTEEALWGTARVWADRADAVTLATYRHRAARWARAYFGPTFPADLYLGPASDEKAAA